MDAFRSEMALGTKWLTGPIQDWKLVPMVPFQKTKGAQVVPYITLLVLYFSKWPLLEPKWVLIFGAVLDFGATMALFIYSVILHALLNASLSGWDTQSAVKQCSSTWKFWIIMRIIIKSNFEEDHSRTLSSIQRIITYNVTLSGCILKESPPVKRVLSWILAICNDRTIQILSVIRRRSVLVNHPCLTLLWAVDNKSVVKLRPRRS